MCKRGDIYYVDFGSNHKSYKQSGIKPAVIVSNNMCRYLQSAV